MKAIAVSCCLLAGPMLAVAGTCSNVDIPVAFTISSTYADPGTGVQYNSAIQPDGGGEYVNGQDNVIAVIHVCNGSYAVTLNANGGPRTLTYDFTKKVNVTSLTPTWTNAPFSTTNTFISFSNIYYMYAANSSYSFTTYMNELYLPNVPGGPYYASMENKDAKAATSLSSNRSPCPNSLVNVAHYPATVNPAAPEHWVVWSDGSQSQFCNGGSFLQVGSLTFNSKGHTQDAGEYSLPFYMTIRKLQ